MGEPVVVVSLNYRVSVWGFLGGQQVKDAGVGNIGLQDRQYLMIDSAYFHAEPFSRS
jgi:acetylcholinesterase